MKTVIFIKFQGRVRGLDIVVAQECFAFRAGLFWPLFKLMELGEAAVLRSGRANGWSDWLAIKLIRELIVVAVLLATITAPNRPSLDLG